MSKCLGYFRIFDTDDEKTIKNIRDRLYYYDCFSPNVYTDKLSKKTKDRKGLKKLIENCEKGDTVVVPNLYRLSYSITDFFSTINKLCEKKVKFKSLDEDIEWNFFYLTDVYKLIFFDKESRINRQKEGINNLRKKGKNVGRKPIPIPSNFEKFVKQWKEKKITKQYCMRMVKMTPSTFDRKYKQWLETQKPSE